MKIHHLGIAIDNLDATLSIFKLTRSDISETVYDDVQKNNLYFIFLKENNLWLELVEPVDQNSTIFKFVNKNKTSLHHLGFHTSKLEMEEDYYTKIPKSFIIGKYNIKVNSFGGYINTLFISFKGLIIEFLN
jgi:hypothetical protein